MASNSSSAPSSSSAPTGSAAIADESANNPYLPANENPDLILTSQPLTGPENYMT